MNIPTDNLKNKTNEHESKNIEKVITKKYQCDSCDLAFNFQSQLNRHKGRTIPCNLIRNNTCEYCEILFSTTGALKKHHKRECKQNPITLVKQYEDKIKYYTEEIEKIKNKFPHKF